jgi:RimJ/RimL family protein N-acetyltransferase
MSATDLPLQTARLRLRELAESDAPFIVTLLNDPDFLRFIGDRGVRNVDDARNYLQQGPIKSYQDNGYGMYLVERREDQQPLGISGLVRREGLAGPDLGFAFLPAYRAMGYALEASRAVLDFSMAGLSIDRVLAIVSTGNAPSIALLEKLGMRSRGTVRLRPDSEELRLFETIGADDGT